MLLKIAQSPIRYALFLQRALFAILTISIILMSMIMLLLDPTQNTFYIYGFLILFFLAVFGGIGLLSFWWSLSIRKEFLDVYQVNKLIGQSLISSGVVTSLVVMHQTEVLNVWSGLITLIIYGLYQVWVGARN